MSISVYVKGIVLPDKKHVNMVELVRLCKKNNVSLPKEVSDYFNNAGIEFILRDMAEGMDVCISSDDWSDGDMLKLM